MSYAVVKADLGRHRKEIFELWEKAYPGVLEKKYRWMYEDNPAGPALVWLAIEEKGGACVGMTALFRREFHANGNRWIGGIAGDLLVDRAHRTAAAALMLQRAVLSAVKEGTVDFIYGFPNQAAEPILKRIGYRLLGERVRLVKVLKSAPYLSRIKGGAYWGRALGPLIDFFGSGYYERKKSGDEAFRCEEVDKADERFDLFWKEAGAGARMIGERKSEYLQWKFLNAPGGGNKVLALFRRDRQELRGYLVYRRREDSIELRDFLFGPDEKEGAVLIRHFLRAARSSGAGSITLPLLKNAQAGAWFQKLGFTERKDPHRIYLYSSGKMLALFPSMIEPANWLLLQSDDDM